eukprot:scaffold97368_cov27-Tisochrysis_lutea.AAC.3
MTQASTSQQAELNDKKSACRNCMPAQFTRRYIGLLTAPQPRYACDPKGPQRTRRHSRAGKIAHCLGCVWLLRCRHHRRLEYG